MIKTPSSSSLSRFPKFKCKLLACVAGLLALLSPTTGQDSDKTPVTGNEYSIVVSGFDWGPAVNKVVLHVGENVEGINASNYSISVKRTTELTAIAPERSEGNLEVLSAYLSDPTGNRQINGQNITLVVAVNPNNPIGTPMEYIGNRNQWIDYNLEIRNTSNNQIWNEKSQLIRPIVDQFDLAGTYTHSDGRSLTYASFEPESNDSDEQLPLIIWLHGAGEGGTDPTLSLMANRVTNYASDEIQSLFGGAYVLVPQTPTFWMQNAEGNYTVGQVNDIQNEALMGLIQRFVENHPRIDTDRIYVGGCSNGGYMSLKLILLHPEYFAAGYISALAYHDRHITDEQVDSIKDVPIWFIHSADDPVTVADVTAIPLYKRLKDAGASDVHLSLFDHVIDLSGMFGGKDYRYNGHFSWIYSHANACRRDFDGSLVELDGKPTTVMEWMASKSK